MAVRLPVTLMWSFVDHDAAAHKQPDVLPITAKLHAVPPIPKLVVDHVDLRTG